MKNEYAPMESRSLCWSCGNAYSGCSWSKNFTPVEGWTAEETKKRGVSGVTYNVRACPEFIPESEKPKANREGIIRVFEAMLSQLRLEYEKTIRFNNSEDALIGVEQSIRELGILKDFKANVERRHLRGLKLIEAGKYAPFSKNADNREYFVCPVCKKERGYKYRMKNNSFVCCAHCGLKEMVNKNRVDIEDLADWLKENRKR